MKPNELTELFAEDRAVSPVVGVALLIAITVILAAVIGGVVLGLGTGGVDTPQAQMQAQYNAAGDNVTIEHNGGEPLPADQITFSGANGDNVTLSEVNSEEDLTAGESVRLEEEGDIDDISEITVLWDDPNSDSTTVLESFEE